MGGKTRFDSVSVTLTLTSIIGEVIAIFPKSKMAAGDLLFLYIKVDYRHPHCLL